MASRLVRANAVTVSDVLDEHKLLEVDCVDRVYLTLSVPSLSHPSQHHSPQSS